MDQYKQMDFDDDFPDIITSQPFLLRVLEKRRQLYLNIDKAMKEYKEAVKRGETVSPPAFGEWEMNGYRAWKIDHPDDAD